MSTRKVALLTAGTLGMVAAGAISYFVYMHAIYGEVGARILSYDSLELSFVDEWGTVREMNCSMQTSSPSLYFRFPKRPNRVYYLPEMTEADVKEFSTFERTGGLGDIPRQYYQDAQTYVTCENGKVIDLTIYEGVEVSKSKSGPFLRLPVSVRKIIKTFGTPQWIQKKHRPFI